MILALYWMQKITVSFAWVQLLNLSYYWAGLIIFILFMWDLQYLEYSKKIPLKEWKIKISVLNYSTVRRFWIYLLVGVFQLSIGFGVVNYLLIFQRTQICNQGYHLKIIWWNYHYFTLVLFLLSSSIIWNLNRQNSDDTHKNNKFLINIIEKIRRNIVIVSKTGKVLFINNKTEKWLAEYCNGLIPENLSELISDYDNTRFFNGISQSYKSPEQHLMQIHMSWQKFKGKI